MIKSYHENEENGKLITHEEHNKNTSNGFILQEFLKDLEKSMSPYLKYYY